MNTLTHIIKALFLLISFLVFINTSKGASPFIAVSDSGQSQQISTPSISPESLYLQLNQLRFNDSLALEEKDRRLKGILNETSKLELDELEGKCYLLLGDLYLESKNISLALFSWKKATGLGYLTKNDTLVVSSLLNIGRLYVWMGKYPKALEYHYKALNYVDSTGGNALQKGVVFSALGELYTDHQKSSKAIHYFSNAHHIFDSLSHGQGSFDALKNLAMIYDKEDQDDKAITILVSLLSKEINITPNDQGALYSDLGRVYTHMHVFDSARFYLLKSIEVLEHQNGGEVKINAVKNLSIFYLEQGKLGEALKYATQAYSLAEGSQHLALLEELSGLIVEIAQKEKHYKLAFEYQELQMHYRQLLFDKAKEAALFEVESRYEVREKEEEIIQQANEIKEKQVELLVLGLSMLILLMLIIVIYKDHRKIRRAFVLLSMKNEKITFQQKEIEKQYDQMKDLYQENESLMGIVAHDLKAPFHKVQGLMKIIKMSGPLNDSQEECVDRIDSSVEQGLDLISDLLAVNSANNAYAQPNYKPLDLHQYFLNFIKGYESQAQKKDIKIYLKGNYSGVLFTDESFLSRILDNLLSNALKFSEPSKSIWIFYNEISSEKISISIKDEGPGFSEEDKKRLYKKFTRLSAKPTDGESSTGLGLAIVKVLLEKLGAEITLNSTPGQGAEFTIILPMKHKQINIAS